MLLQQRKPISSIFAQRTFLSSSLSSFPFSFTLPNSPTNSPTNSPSGQKLRPFGDLHEGCLIPFVIDPKASIGYSQFALISHYPLQSTVPSSTHKRKKKKKGSDTRQLAIH